MPRRAALAWTAVLALAGLVAATDTGTDGGDVAFFLTAGERLLSGDWASAYADPAVQSGPASASLLRARAVDPVGGAHGRRAGRRSRTARLGGAPRAARPGPAAALDGHRDSAGSSSSSGCRRRRSRAVTPRISSFPRSGSSQASRRGTARSLAAGALVGVSAGFETWGLLGIVVLALAPRARDAAAGLGVATAVAAALFAPFALVGDFRMLDVRLGGLGRHARGARARAGQRLRVDASGSRRRRSPSGAGAAVAWRLRGTPARAPRGAPHGAPRAPRRSIPCSSRGTGSRRSRSCSSSRRGS